MSAGGAMYKTAGCHPSPSRFLQVAVTALLVQCPAVVIYSRVAARAHWLKASAAVRVGRRGADCPGRQDRLTGLTAYTLQVYLHVIALMFSKKIFSYPFLLFQFLLEQSHTHTHTH